MSAEPDSETEDNSEGGREDDSGGGPDGNWANDRANEAANDPVRARRKAMDYLARREHAAGELNRKLVAAGFAAETAAAAVGQLAREGLQDDRRFVESFVQSRIGQGKGPVRIRLELAQHGVEGAVVEVCLDAAAAEWPALARQVRDRKFGPQPPRDFREKARQMRFLQYRGFETDHIRRAVGTDGDD